MIDQLVIGDKSSFDDFSASLTKRTINQPKKKSIKEKVPFSNVTYDFSAIDGEVYWEERGLEYVFEMTADTPEKLEDMKNALSNWMMNVIGEDIYDPFIPDYHFVGTFDDMSFADEADLEKTTATVKFTAYPYKVANYPKVYEIVVPSYDSKTIYILNESSHRITPTIIAEQSVTLEFGGAEYSLAAGTVKSDSLMLAAGLNALKVSNPNSEDNKVTISFYEEVF